MIPQRAVSELSSKIEKAGPAETLLSLFQERLSKNSVTEGANLSQHNKKPQIQVN
jgi:hypothetical protein